jgi:ABC-type multidrug transport system fused ATPase/permease subunit
LDIKPSGKVALCGRTGRHVTLPQNKRIKENPSRPNKIEISSGKSPILLSLVRLIELNAGVITLDDVDISTIPLQTLRRLITAIPQDPVIFPGSSIRRNLDPMDRYVDRDDAELVSSLQKVLVWDMVRDRGGLDDEFTGFSEGQKQLFCLARCPLYSGKVVLLDKVTSSVDHETEGAIRYVLRTEFKDKCTLVEVLHRLDHIGECDQVVVMRDGMIAEVGQPADLLEKRDSLLREMWDARHGGFVFRSGDANPSD